MAAKAGDTPTVQLLLGNHNPADESNQRPRLSDGVKDALIVGTSVTQTTNRWHVFVTSATVCLFSRCNSLAATDQQIPSKEITLSFAVFIVEGIRMGHEGVVRSLLWHFDGLDLKSALLAASMAGNEAIMTSLLTHVQSDMLQFSECVDSCCQSLAQHAVILATRFGHLQVSQSPSCPSAGSTKRGSKSAE